MCTFNNALLAVLNYLYYICIDFDCDWVLPSVHSWSCWCREQQLEICDKRGTRHNIIILIIVIIIITMIFAEEEQSYIDTCWSHMHSKLNKERKQTKWERSEWRQRRRRYYVNTSCSIYSVIIVKENEGRLINSRRQISSRYARLKREQQVS